jgi:hypothetical protein
MKRDVLSRGAWVALVVGMISVFPAGLASGGEAIPNWAAPAFWSPPRATRGVTIQGDITNPLPFIGVTPCRQYDSRNATPLPQNTAREVVITGAPCGLPSGAAAVSLNVTVFDILGQTGNAVFQVGTTSNPTTAWINYPIGQGQIGNAGVLPLSGSHSIFFRVQQGGGSIDFTIDVNGYYANTPANSLSTFEIHNSSGWAILGHTACSGFLCRGVFGIASATTGETKGVFGETDSSSDRAAGVEGYAPAATGETYGVRGVTLSITNHAAGVLGIDGAGVANPTAGPTLSAGVIGHGRNGVIGRTSKEAGSGLVGVAEDTGGSLTAEGRVGIGGDAFMASLGGYAGPSPSITVDPHPTDASAIISYTSLTGNEAGTYFRGTAQTTGREFVIDVPEDFRMVTEAEGLTVQLTPVGASATMYVMSEDLSQITVHSSRDVKFHYLVQGVRIGHKDDKPLRESMEHPVFLPQTPEGKMQEAWPQYVKQRLIANGTYNSDGTINMQTAERVGWAKAWRDREEQAKAAAAASRAAREAKGENK